MPPPTPPHLRLDRIARHTDWLEFDCRQCGRRGRYRIARLIAEHGPGYSVSAVKDAARADCPRWQSEQRGERVSIYELCQAGCPTLAWIGD